MSKCVASAGEAFPAPLSDVMIDLKLTLMIMLCTSSLSYIPCSISQLVCPALCPRCPCLPIVSNPLLWALKPSYASAPAAIRRSTSWLHLAAFSLTATAFPPCSLACVQSTACGAKRRCSRIPSAYSAVLWACFACVMLHGDSTTTVWLLHLCHLSLSVDCTCAAHGVLLYRAVH